MTASYVDPDSSSAEWGEDDSYTIIGLDPGGITGWAVLALHPDVMSGDPEFRVLDNIDFWTAGQFTGGEDSQTDEIVDLIQSWPNARIVMEDFILRKMNMGRDLLAPVRITAKVEWAIRPRYFVLQQPAMAMTTITDDRQKSMGLWLPGQEHARDAVKHVFTFAKRKRDQAIKAAAISAASARKAG
jgi:hypothetical protein